MAPLSTAPFNGPITAPAAAPVATRDPDAQALVSDARRTVLVRRPLHWQVASALIAALERAWAELDRRAQVAIDAAPNEERLPPVEPETGASGISHAANRATPEPLRSSSGA